MPTVTVDSAYFDHRPPDRRGHAALLRGTARANEEMARLVWLGQRPSGNA